MDRRQKKTREAIFEAFTTLLSEKNYNQISVQEIIDEADVGRTTFYAHFETKDYLLKEFCEDLFDHMIETAHGHYTDAHRETGGSIFLHLLIHVQENNRNIATLLSSPNNDIFMRYFRDDMNQMVLSQYADHSLIINSGLPEDYLVNHISSSFVATVNWWLSQKMKESPETIEHYFRMTLDPLLEYYGEKTEISARSNP